MSSCPDILKKITENRKIEVEKSKKHVDYEELIATVNEINARFGKPLSVLDRVYLGGSEIAVAAEFKRASPSKGDIDLNLNPKDQGRLYASAGASIISVLTESSQFKGSLHDMMLIREEIHEMIDRPAVLRKDFIFDEYQIAESRAYGADSVLLIVSILDQDKLESLIQESRKFGMEPLVEVNNVEELQMCLKAKARFVGVNNRNLHTFKLDMDTTMRICDALSSEGYSLGKTGVTLFALSGISNRKDVEIFEKSGVNGILVGESLMKSSDPGRLIRELQGIDAKHKPIKSTIVKLCGMTRVEDAIMSVQQGANMVGMIFASGSPRSVDLSTAKSIVAAVHDFGERSSRVDLRSSIKLSEENSRNSRVWFTKWLSNIQEISSRTPLVVGVFLDQDPVEINRVVNEVGLDLVQLHGDEGYEVCDEIDVPCIRVIHLPEGRSEEAIQFDAISEHIQPGKAVSLLLDTTVKGQKGGTGKTFDWSVAETLIRFGIPCLMAGGLTPMNIRKAIHKCNPGGVDVSSGIEVDDTPGVKDTKKILEFMHAIRSINKEMKAIVVEETEEESQ